VRGFKTRGGGGGQPPPPPHDIPPPPALEVRHEPSSGNRAFPYPFPAFVGPRVRDDIFQTVASRSRRRGWSCGSVAANTASAWASQVKRGVRIALAGQQHGEIVFHERHIGMPSAQAVLEDPQRPFVELPGHHGVTCFRRRDFAPETRRQRKRGAEENLRPAIVRCVVRRRSTARSRTGAAGSAPAESRFHACRRSRSRSGPR
jgi:hypothetical protein